MTSSSSSSASTASSSKLVWPLPNFDGEAVEVKVLAAIWGRVTFRISNKAGGKISDQFPLSDIVLKWSSRRSVLAELDLNKRFQSKRFVPLLGGGILDDAPLDEAIPGLKPDQYKRLRDQMKEMADGVSVVRPSDNKLNGARGEQDVIVQQFMSQQSFSPSKAKGSPGRWSETRERLSSHIGEALDELDQDELVHGDCWPRNIFVDESSSSPSKPEFRLGDFGKVRKRKRRGERSELSTLLRVVDEIREDVITRASPPKGVRSQRRARPPIRTRLIFP